MNDQWVCTWNGSNVAEVLKFLKETKWDCRIVGKMNAQRLYVKPEDVGWDAEEVVAVGQKLMKDMDGHVSVF